MSLASKPYERAFIKPAESEGGPNGPGPQLIARPLTDFNLPARGDPSVLIGNRFLCRGDIAILASTSGMGKSSLSIQMATHWALGRPIFDGLRPHRPLKSLIFQAEDGEGDIAEVRHSLEFAMGITDDYRRAITDNVVIVTDRIHRGLSFRQEIQRQAAIHNPDIVIINPLLAFMGGDVNDSTDVGHFIREQLNSLNEPPRFAYLIIHHTSKPPKERSERRWNEVMYEMAGSADLTNAARAILSLQPTDQPGEFVLRIAKRGQRAGFTTTIPGSPPTLVPTNDVPIRHSRLRMVVDGQDLPVIHWERYDGQPAKSTSKSGRPAKYPLELFIDKIPHGPDAALPPGQIWRDIHSRSGISVNAFKDLLFRSADAGHIHRREVQGGVLYYQ